MKITRLRFQCLTSRLTQEESIFEFENVGDYAHAFLKAMSGPETLVLGKGEEGSMRLEVILEEGSGDLVIR